MPIKLSVQIESPLTPDDRDLLAGIAVMTLAIANRELGQQNVQPEQEPVPDPCGAIEYAAKSPHEATGKVCISEVGHTGRHRFRAIPGAELRGLN